MKKIYAVYFVLFELLSLSTLAEAQTFSTYACRDAYTEMYRKTVGENEREKSIENNLDGKNLNILGSIGAGATTTAMIIGTATFGVAGLASGLVFAWPVALGIYSGITGVIHLSRSWRENTYHQANGAIVFSLLENPTRERKNALVKLTNRINRHGYTVSYETVKAKVAELSQTSAFCENGSPASFGKLEKIVVDSLVESTPPHGKQ